MGIFGTPRTPAADATVNKTTEQASGAEPAAEGFEFGVRKEIQGPLPVVDSIIEMAQWLENARRTVVETDATCCLAVCSANPIEGAALDLVVGDIADRFANSLRSYDKIFRHGREKLLIGLPHVKSEDATAVLQRLHDIVERMPFKMPGKGLDLAVTVSLGGVMMDQAAVEQLINRAEKAMELGRITGERNCIWTPELN